MNEAHRRKRERDIAESLLALLLVKGNSPLYQTLLIQDLLRAEFVTTFLSQATGWPSPRTAKKMADEAASDRLAKIMPGILATLERTDQQAATTEGETPADTDESLAGSPILAADPEQWVELVAISETTAALSAAIIAEHGTKTLVWRCLEGACEICSPLDGEPIAEVGSPPAHPSCRCLPEVADDENE